MKWKRAQPCVGLSGERAQPYAHVRNLSRTSLFVGGRVEGFVRHDAWPGGALAL